MKIAVTKKLTRAAVLFALLLVLQSFKNLSQLIAGPAVNVVLIVATLSVGVFCGVLFSIAAPFTAWLVSGAVPPPMIMTKGTLALAVIVGNLALVLCVYFFSRIKSRDYQGKRINYPMLVLGIATGCIVKWLLMWGIVTLVVLPMFPQLPEKIVVAILAGFTHIQLLTSAIGGAVTLVVWKPLEIFLNQSK